MNKIYNALKNKKSLITFITAGDPSLEKTEEYIYTMADSGVDLIELGLPFSDPVAEGPVIEKANYRALANGTTVNKIFDMLERVSKKVSIPMVFLTYVNVLHSYGYEEFCHRCNKSGIEGFIIPDMPYDEHSELKEIADKYNLSIISLIAPTTSEKRIAMIAKESKGFIYVVSSLGVTGMRSNFNEDLKALIDTIKKYTDTPICVGFGISNKEHVEKFHKIADGAIIGSAIVKIIEENPDNANEKLKEFIDNILK